MVAYQGEVAFEHAGSGGLAGWSRRPSRARASTLMKMSGTGEVFLADTAQDIHHLPRERRDHRQRREPARLRRGDRLGHQARRGRVGHDGRRPVQHGAARAAAGWRSSPTAARAAQHRRRADVRRPCRRRSPGVQRPDRHQDRRQAEEPHRPSSGESVQMSFAGPAGCSCSRARAARTARVGGGGGGGGLLGNLTAGFGHAPGAACAAP